MFRPGVALHRYEVVSAGRLDGAEGAGTGLWPSRKPLWHAGMRLRMAQKGLKQEMSGNDLRAALCRRLLMYTTVLTMGSRQAGGS